MHRSLALGRGLWCLGPMAFKPMASPQFSCHTSVRWTQSNSRRWRTWKFVWETKHEFRVWKDACCFNRRGAVSLLSWSSSASGPHLLPPTLLWSIDHRVTIESFVTPSNDFQCDWKNQTLLDDLQGLSGPWPRSCFPSGYTFPTPSHCLPDTSTLCSPTLEYQNLADSPSQTALPLYFCIATSSCLLSTPVQNYLPKLPLSTNV